jgi:hypothetical protein
MMTAAPARMTIQMDNDGDGRVSPVVWSYEAIQFQVCFFFVLFWHELSTSFLVFEFLTGMKPGCFVD